MVLNKFYWFLLVIVFSGLACDPKVDTNAEYQETPLLYALLDQKDSIHTVRLQKGFQNPDGDATALAKIADSSLYDPQQVALYLLRQRGPSIDTIGRFYPDSVFKNTDGDFFSGHYQAYKVKANLSANDQDRYFVRFQNLRTGHVCQSNPINLIQNFVFQSPFEAFGTPDIYMSRNNFEVTRDVRAEIFSSNVYLTYEESLNGEPFVEKNLVWRVSNQKVVASGGEVKFEGDVNLATFLIRNIDISRDTPNTKRRINRSVRIEVLAAGSNYRLFREINYEFSSVSQVQPIYTNVQGGLGLVGTRYQKELVGLINRGSFNSTFVSTLDEANLKLKFERI